MSIRFIFYLGSRLYPLFTQYGARMTARFSAIGRNSPGFPHIPGPGYPAAEKMPEYLWKTFNPRFAPLQQQLQPFYLYLDCYRGVLINPPRSLSPSGRVA